MSYKCLYNVRLAMVCVMAVIIGRLLPHPDNVTPLTNLSLFIGMHLPWKMGFLYVSICNLLCDILLSFLKNYSSLGSWSIFTYSSILGMVWMGSFIRTTKIKIISIYVLISTLGFWLWTNFGVWLMDGVYPKNLIGLLACYQLALPFLRNSLLGDFLWMIITFGFGLRIFHFQKTIFINNPFNSRKAEL